MLQISEMVEQKAPTFLTPFSIVHSVFHQYYDVACGLLNREYENKNIKYKESDSGPNKKTHGQKNPTESH